MLLVKSQKQLCMQLTKAYKAKMSCNQVASATYLLRSIHICHKLYTSELYICTYAVSEDTTVLYMTLWGDHRLVI